MSKQNTAKEERYLSGVRAVHQRQLDSIAPTNYREVVRQALSHQHSAERLATPRPNRIFGHTRHHINAMLSPLLNWSRSHRLLASCVVTATTAVCILVVTALLVQYQQTQLVAPLFTLMQSIAIDYSLALY